MGKEEKCVFCGDLVEPTIEFPFKDFGKLCKKCSTNYSRLRVLGLNTEEEYESSQTFVNRVIAGRYASEDVKQALTGIKKTAASKWPRVKKTRKRIILGIIVLLVISIFWDYPGTSSSKDDYVRTCYVCGEEATSTYKGAPTCYLHSHWKRDD